MKVYVILQDVLLVLEGTLGKRIAQDPALYRMVLSFVMTAGDLPLLRVAIVLLGSGSCGRLGKMSTQAGDRLKESSSGNTQILSPYFSCR